jgi:DNA topoisomerase-1
MAETEKKRSRKPAKAKRASEPVETDIARVEPDAEPVAEEEDGEDAGAAKGKKRSLVIVESPAKAKTINKYLGRDFVVKASMGHIRDLPKGKFGIDIEHGFKPDYATIKGKTKVISELKRLAKNAPTVYLAPDLDREGEAIAWHLRESLDVDETKVFRVVFNEITKKAILEAFEHPGKLDMHKVDAQQARRVLDRIMGYKLSPLLWKKIAKGLSAGRVQSVAVRLIVEREKEIRAFVKEEYWRVTANFKEGEHAYHAELRRIGEERIDKNLDGPRAQEIVRRIGKDALHLSEIDHKPKTRRPTPPFTTSQLQQKASTMLRFSARKTMMIAQQLYEGVEVSGEGSVGLITYMRTDSVRVSNEALTAARSLIESQFGANYVPEKATVFTARA